MQPTLDSAKIVLEAYLKERDITSFKERGDKYLILDNCGNKISPWSVNSILKKHAKNVSISQGITSLWLRRTYAQLLLEGGLRQDFLSKAMRSCEMEYNLLSKY